MPVSFFGWKVSSSGGCAPLIARYKMESLNRPQKGRTMSKRSEAKAAGLQRKLSAKFPQLDIYVGAEFHSLYVHAESEIGRLDEYVGDLATNADLVAEISQLIDVAQQRGEL